MSVELVGCEGLVVAISAYLHPSTREGLSDLDRALHYAKQRSPRVLVGMDGNKHNPWWGQPCTLTNPVGEMIENLLLELDLEIVNCCNCPPTLILDVEHCTWIGLTLGTQSRALSMLDWFMYTNVLIGSDHRVIFFRTSTRLCTQRCSM